MLHLAFRYLCTLHISTYIHVRTYRHPQHLTTHPRPQLPVSEIDFISTQDETALLLAIEEGHIESVQELLKGGASAVAQASEGEGGWG